jgi:nitroimidazol reductase NimA-like FMN-containing flavoprotein (pyridoxamine 5'-phosphate oxidase superfamily)
MQGRDEPVLKGVDPPEEEETPVRERIRALLNRQLFAVLCTQGENQPYGSVVALAVDESLANAVFATSRATRKYRLLSSCDRVAFVVDDRDRHPDELMSVAAVTGTGRAREVESVGKGEHWERLFLAKHPGLRGFVEAPSTAIFRIEVVRYLHVWRFQEVRQWVPPGGA